GIAQAAMLERIREATLKGLPLGSPAFLERVEREYGFGFGQASRVRSRRCERLLHQRLTSTVQRLRYGVRVFDTELPRITHRITSPNYHRITPNRLQLPTLPTLPKAKLERGAAEAARGELLEGDEVFKELREMIEERRRSKAGR
ncbi:MAG TPA: hypothetical protein VE621_02230, partial [Bryobacteraceae bacterium]|nr:hypothetical protein [Bryobacteraceae bacterium]